MTILWCMLVLSVIVAGVIAVGYFVLQNEMKSISEIIIDHFEEDMETEFDLDGMIAYHAENEIVDYAI